MKKYRYEVWALGFDKDDMCTDIETILGSFSDADSAIQFAKMFTTVETVTDRYVLNEELAEGDYLDIAVETIEEGDESNTNIDTKYSALVFQTEKMGYVISYLQVDAENFVMKYGIATNQVFNSRTEANFHLEHVTIPEAVEYYKNMCKSDEHKISVLPTGIVELFIEAPEFTIQYKIEQVEKN